MNLATWQLDRQSYKNILRYAEYTHEPYARNGNATDYGAAICMRGDLEHGGTGSPGGCYDSKVRVGCVYRVTFDVTVDAPVGVTVGATVYVTVHVAVEGVGRGVCVSDRLTVASALTASTNYRVRGGRRGAADAAGPFIRRASNAPQVTSYLGGFRDLECEAVSGPSSRASSPISTLAPFSWRPAVDNATLHLGLPATFAFPFVTMKPAAL